MGGSVSNWWPSLALRVSTRHSKSIFSVNLFFSLSTDMEVVTQSLVFGLTTNVS